MYLGNLDGFMRGGSAQLMQLMLLALRTSLNPTNELLSQNFTDSAYVKIFFCIIVAMRKSEEGTRG